MVQVTVYRDSDTNGAGADFDVPPRIDEKLEWPNPATNADAVYRVVSVRHERRAGGFQYVIGVTIDP